MASFFGLCGIGRWDGTLEKCSILFRFVPFVSSCAAGQADPFRFALSHGGWRERPAGARKALKKLGKYFESPCHSRKPLSGALSLRVVHPLLRIRWHVQYRVALHVSARAALNQARRQDYTATKDERRERQPPREGQILTGPLFNEPMRVETVRSLPGHHPFREAAERHGTPSFWFAANSGERSRNGTVRCPCRRWNGSRACWCCRIRSARLRRCSGFGRISRPRRWGIITSEWMR